MIAENVDVMPSKCAHSRRAHGDTLRISICSDLSHHMAQIILKLFGSGRRQLTMLVHLPNNVGFSLYVGSRGGYSTPIICLFEWPGCWRL